MAPIIVDIKIISYEGNTRDMMFSSNGQDVIWMEEYNISYPMDGWVPLMRKYPTALDNDSYEYIVLECPITDYYGLTQYYRRTIRFLKDNNNIYSTIYWYAPDNKWQVVNGWSTEKPRLQPVNTAIRGESKPASQAARPKYEKSILTELKKAPEPKPDRKGTSQIKDKLPSIIKHTKKVLKISNSPRQASIGEWKKAYTKEKYKLMMADYDSRRDAWLISPLINERSEFAVVSCDGYEGVFIIPSFNDARKRSPNIGRCYRIIGEGDGGQIEDFAVASIKGDFAVLKAPGLMRRVSE